MNKKFLSLLVILICRDSFSQFNPPNPSVPSANLSSSKQEIQINNDLYNGKINVSFPLLSYEYEGLQFPITLSYSGGNGIKTDEIPGWVGLGWSLTAGGYIHRTIRGKPDETRDFETWIDTYDLGGGNMQSVKTTTLNGTDFSYFSNFNKLTVSNWYTQANANTLKPPASNYSYSIPINGGTRTVYNHYPMYDLAPDEFTFSAGNISGKFYLNHLGKWVVVSNDGNIYTVNVYTGEQYINAVQKIPKIIKYITLTSVNGVKYYFGNSNINAPFENQYFDYSHSSSALPVNAWEYSPIGGATLIDIVPHTWHLTKIENLRTGSVITFDYKLEGWQFYKSKQVWGHNGGIVYSNNQFFFNNSSNWNTMYRLSAITKVATRPWTLTAINFPNNVKIEFESSLSTQMSSNDGLMSSDNSGFYQYDDMYLASGNNKLLQLNRIIVRNNNQIKNEINFLYSGNINQRLKLTSVRKGDGTGGYNETHSFSYNTLQLPAYATGKSDHWGYYNNKDFFTSVSSPYNDFTKLSTYNSYREPDNLFIQAEILNAITFPNGGQVQFEYEPHSYSKKIDGDFTISNTANTTGGGVRIHKIAYKTGGSTIALEKIYEYTIPGGSTSSGILSLSPQQYLIGTPNSFSFNSSGFNPIYYSGSPVTYSYVKERQVNNGYTLFQYSNYDNGFNDVPPIEKNTVPSAYFDYAYKNNSFKRGKLLLAKTVNESGTTLEEREYKYEHDNSETNKDEVRSLYFKEQGTLNYFYTSVSDKLYADLSIEEKIRNYSSSGILQTQTNSIYDSYGNIKESTSFDSKGKVVKTKYKYCYEYASGGTDMVSQGINYLSSLGIKNAVVEKIVIRQNADGSNPYIVEGIIYVYNSQSAFLKQEYKLQLSAPLTASSFVESSITNGIFLKDPGYGTNAEIEYSKYDSKGNPLEAVGKDGVIKSFIWGYNSSYLVASVVGVNYNTAIALLSQSILDNPSNDQTLRSHLNNLRNLGGAVVTTYTYNPLVGITSETDARAKTTYYEYDAFNRLVLIRDKDNKVIRKICYNYAGETENCAVGFFYNNAISAVYTRNNCPTGYTGSTVTYTVPANTYTSSISQADANQQAQNDVNTNGQAYANTNGTCTALPPPPPPPTCSTSNCNGVDKKCINGVCETGTWGVVSSIYKKVSVDGFLQWRWVCTYRYCFSDASQSTYYSEVYNTSSCPITCGFSVE